MKTKGPRTKHIALWGAWYGSHNVGDQALLLSIMDTLKSLLRDARFIVFTDNPEHVIGYAQRESNSRVTAYHNRRQFHRLVHTLATCDLFIFGGGVPFYSERDHLFAMALLVGMARAFRTPYMTWTVSSQVVEDKTAKFLFRWIIEGAQVVTYRDKPTYELFRSCGSEREMILTVDPGYRLEPECEETAVAVLFRAGWKEIKRPLVALTPRTLRGRNRDAEKHYNVKTPELYEREVSCFAAALDWLWEHEYQPILVPMNTVAPDDDRIAARRVMEIAEYGRYALLIDEEIRPRVAPVIYKQCQCSFVARVHGSVTSMIGNCPVMMYAFAPKHVGIMEANGLNDYVLLESQATPESTVKMLSNLVSNSERERRFMAKQLVKLRQEALIPGKLAVKIIGES